MKPGYCFECADFSRRNDDWETVIYTPRGDEKRVGRLTIDGAECVVFLCPADGWYRAQTVVSVGL